MSSDHLHILLIEDQEPEYKQCYSILTGIKSWTSSIDWAPCFISAIDLAKQSKYDVYLVDYTLGDHTGLDFFITACNYRSAPPTILLVPERDHDIENLAVKAGVQDCIRKGQLSQIRVEQAIRYAIARKEKDRLRDEFIATVNHELRTPLTAINGSINAMLLGFYGEASEDSKRMVNIARRNCNRMLRLVDDLADLHLIESGILSLEHHPIHVQAVVQQAIQDIEPFATAYGIPLKLEQVATDPIWVLGDSLRLGQILANLLSNAIKYSPVDEIVTIQIRREKERVLISVSDQGPGIPQSQQSFIFQKYAQALSPTARKTKNMGLGLYISRNLIEAHGGNIWVESRVNEGATFYFSVPLIDQPVLPSSPPALERLH